MMGKQPSHHAKTGPGPISKTELRPMFDVKSENARVGEEQPTRKLKKHKLK